MKVKHLRDHFSEDYSGSKVAPVALPGDFGETLQFKDPCLEMNKKESQSINVLQFLCFRSPYGGSFFQSLLKLEQTIKKDGLDMVYLFHSDTSDIDWVQNLINGGRKVYFLTGSLVNDFAVLRKIVIRHNIKYIHAHFAGLKYFFLFNLLKFFYSRQLLIIRHLRNHDQPRGFMAEILRKLLTHIDLYIGCSESVAIEYRKNFKIRDEKITHVTNAIDFNRLNKFDALKRENYQIDKNTTVFLLFGFDYYRKGVDVVLEAMNMLITQGHDVCLLLSLSVNRKDIESKIIDRFQKLPDWLKILDPREDVASYYRLSDFFISASREEGFCNSLVEAAYCDCPIITSDIPGPRSLNIPHTYQFESENINELHKAMVSAISLSKIQKRQISSDQREFVVKEFDLDNWAYQIKDVYKKLN